MLKQLGAKYNPKEFEEKMYRKWEDEKVFYADEQSKKPSFSLVLPPPNITGRLHMGHALNHTLQDILARQRRMAGYEVLWLPGTDHASIATEVLVVRMLREKYGKSKRDFTREEFLEHAWDWRNNYGRQIVEQTKRLGSSMDWTKERFTMDEYCSKAVVKTFIELYEKGYIYRGDRMITWCPSCQTTISDAEIDHEERDGKLYYVRYPLASEVKGKELGSYDASAVRHVLVATSRPETMFGDIAIAVHPEDLRYKDIIGKKVVVPVNGRKIPIITSEEIEIEFGTGALKVTPAHSETDYEIGLANDLEAISCIDEDGTMNAYALKYEGQDRAECRKNVSADLEAQGFVEKIEDYKQVVGRCDRCKTDTEPRISLQWFVKMEELAKPAIEAYKKGELVFHPANYGKLYIGWLEKIRDWNISRQLWWGHKVPAYYCEDCDKVYVAEKEPSACECGGKIYADEDVLDTWFSSALWPFSTMGWPDSTKLLDKFYPTNVLLTSYDIIPLWVVRMVFQGLEQTGKLPFKDVIINGLVRDKYGKKMSKSAGNGIDPMDLIESYGVDALRFGLISGNSMGVDIRVSNDRIENARNFANKLWNASRFVIHGIEGVDLSKGLEAKEFDLADRWMLARTSRIISEVTALFDKYDTNFAASKLYDFIWSEYCDWYIELSKRSLYSDDPKRKEAAANVLFAVLKAILKLVHPYMPFITEEIWEALGETGSLALAAWPVAIEFPDASDEEIDGMEVIMEAIRSIRNARATMNVPNSKKAACYVLRSEGAEIFAANKGYLESLASASSVELTEEEPAETLMVNAGAYTLFVSLADLIDKEKERERLEKEKKNLEADIEKIGSRLANEGFVSKAPARVVEADRKKHEELLGSLEKVNEQLAKL